MFRVIILPKAFNDLSKLDKSISKRIIEKIIWLSENAENITHFSLKGRFNELFKLRIGDWRVIYDLDYEQRIMTVHKVGHRSEIYK